MSTKERLREMIQRMIPAQIESELQAAYKVVAQMDELKALADIEILEEHLKAIRN